MRLQVTLLFLVATEGKKKPKENDDVVIPNVDVFPAPFPHPVPFGHIFKDGIGDIVPGQKQPVDPLELRLITPMRQEQDKYLKMVPKTNILKLVPEPEANSDLRDELKRFKILHPDDYPEENESNQTKTLNRSLPGWFQFEAILDHNILTPLPPVSLRAKKPDNESASEAPVSGHAQHFSGNNFRLLNDPDVPVTYDEWPTCDKFEKKTTTFMPKDIVDIDWVPFYVWTTRNIVIAIVHRFSFPTKKAVVEYKKTYGPYLNTSVDWESPKLLLQEEVEMLLIAADRNGLFHTIPKIKLPYGIKNLKNPKLPVGTLRLRIEDPYLALMYCDDYYATIMAAPGAEPENDLEKTQEASVLNIKFRGFPLERDLYLEKLQKKAEIERQRQLEETKIIKALDTGFDIERL